MNLKAHVAPKDEKHPGAVCGIRLGASGTESTDGYSVFLRVPYPVPEARADEVEAVTGVRPNVIVYGDAWVGPTLPLTDCDAMAKAVNTPAATLRKEPGRGHVVVDVEEGAETSWEGKNKDGGAVTLEGKTHGTAWPETSHLPVDREPSHEDRVLTLGLGALEKLLKAARALGAEGIEIRMVNSWDEIRWKESDAGKQYQVPAQVRILDEDAQELARGAITPTIR